MTAPGRDGCLRAIPYLFVRGGSQALEFYKAAFGAEERIRLPGPDGKLGHAEIQLGDSPIWLADEVPELGFSSPSSLGGVGVAIFLYVSDVDVAFACAVAAGAESLRPVEDQFYGDRVGTLRDPFGHIWTLATRKEVLTSDAIRRRAEAFLRPHDGQS